MNIRYAHRIEELKPSAIREMLKINGDIISFAAGNPSPRAIPYRDILRIANEILSEQPIEALQYSITEGYGELRDYLRDDLKRRWRIGDAGDDIIITSGAQQVMELCAKAMCDEGDVVICEEPSFIGALNAFRSYGARLAGVPVDKDGMNTDILEQRLKEEPRAKFIYTIPNFQNPTGTCLSPERRKRMLDLAREYDCMIIEDNPYGELRFRGEDIPCIKSFDTDNRVVYAGSFSKIISPGLRVGYCLADASLTARLTACKQVSDVHTGVINQMICYRFLKQPGYKEHLIRNREIYREKADLMKECCDRFLPDYATVYPVSGGMFMWVELPPRFDAAKLCAELPARGVAAVPGNTFSADLSSRTCCFRLNYATPSEDEIERGIKIIGEAIAETDPAGGR